MKQNSLVNYQLKENLPMTKKKFESDIDENKHKLIYRDTNPFVDINEITKKRITHQKIFEEEKDTKTITLLCSDNIVKNLSEDFYKTSSTEIQTPKVITRTNSSNLPNIISSLFNYEKKRNISPDKEFLENQNFYMSKKRKIAKKQHSNFTREIDLMIPDTKQNINFRLFKDEEIGFSSQWKEYLHDQDADEDIESTDEIIINATDYIFERLEEGIKSVVENDYVDVQNYKLNNLYV
jgi:hypothetical protein